jgi:hypothetical protein
MSADNQTENKRTDGTLAPGNTLGNRWQPGQSGNPKGRPKGVTLSEAIRRRLTEQAPGKSEQTYAEVIAAALCKQAAKGNVLACKEIMDRTEGKPRQALDVDMNVRDWRDLVESYRLDKEDVYAEVRRLVESVDDSSGL